MKGTGAIFILAVCVRSSGRWEIRPTAEEL